MAHPEAGDEADHGVDHWGPSLHEAAPLAAGQGGEQVEGDAEAPKLLIAHSATRCMKSQT